MQIISNQTTQAGYVDALTLGPDDFEALTVDVWNQTVVMQVFTAPGGHYQQGSWQDEILVPPSSVSLQRCGGVRFRTNPNGTAGIVNAYGWRNGEVVITGGLQLTGTLSASGVVTPGGVTELDYTSRLTILTVNAVAEAAALALFTSAAITFDGSTVCQVIVACPYFQKNNTASGGFNLYIDGTDQGRLAEFTNTTGVTVFDTMTLISPKFTPSSGSHTISVRAWNTAAVNVNVGSNPPSDLAAYMLTIVAL